MARARWPRLLLAAWLALLWTAAPSAVDAAPPATQLRIDCGSFAHHVAVVVEHGDGRTLTRCLGFSTDTVSGSDLLQLMKESGIEYATSGYGGSLGDALCQVDNEPTTYPPGCWTSTSYYWEFFVARSGAAWLASSKGISTQTFADGDAAGFRYEPQDGSGGPPVAATGVCSAMSTPPGMASAAILPRSDVPHSPSPPMTPATAAAVSAAPSPSVTGAAGTVRLAAKPASSSVVLSWLVFAVVAGALTGALLIQVLSRRRPAASGTK